MQYFLASGGGLLSFATGFGIWVAISTLLFLYLMNKFLVPPTIAVLPKRESQTKDYLGAAAHGPPKPEQITKDNAKALKEAEIQAQKIRKEALEDAELLRSDKIEQAKADAEKILETARVTIEQEKKRALSELRNEVADLAVEAAGIIIQAELDKDKTNKLVDTFIGNLSKNN